MKEFSFTMGSATLRRMLQQSLLPGEDVQYALNTICLKDNGENECIFAITQRRVLCCSRKLFLKEISQIPLSAIQGTEIKGKKLGSRELHITGITQSIVIVALLDTLQKIQFSLEWVINNQDQLSRSEPEDDQPNADVIFENDETEIERQLHALKRLLDEGLLTQDEFNAKKQQLLGL